MTHKTVGGKAGRRGSLQPRAEGSDGQAGVGEKIGERFHKGKNKRRTKKAVREGKVGGQGEYERNQPE